jgi:hypothetical protein
MDTVDLDEYGNEEEEEEVDNVFADFASPAAIEVKSIDVKSYQDPDGNSKMSLADWRWAAQRGFWNPDLRQWNEEMGGITAYIEQRDKRRMKRLSRQPRCPKVSGLNVGNGHSRSAQRFSAAELKASKWSTAPASMQSKGSGFFNNANESELGLTTGSPLLMIMARNGWGHHVARRFWNAGYDKDAVTYLYDGLPPSIRSSIRKVLDAAQLCADCGLQCGRADVEDCTTPLRSSQADTAMIEWEKDNVHAYLERHFDPETQECIGAAANSRAAALLGMRREELLARLERGDVPLPLPPLDAVAVFLHALGTSRDAVTTKYLRLYSWAHSPAEERLETAPLLVCWTSTKSFDSDGRIFKVRQCGSVPVGSRSRQRPNCTSIYYGGEGVGEDNHEIFRGSVPRGLCRPADLPRHAIVLADADDCVPLHGAWGATLR